ncbi:hypothetical protein D3C80_1726160 [compost metagenome]
MQQGIPVTRFHIHLKAVIARNSLPDTVYSGIHRRCIQFSCFLLHLGPQIFTALLSRQYSRYRKSILRLKLRQHLFYRTVGTAYSDYNSYTGQHKRRLVRFHATVLPG